MKPSWSEAPSWAMWLAQNDDGQWWWYEEKPILCSHMGCFCEEGGRSEEATYAEDWEDTLEQRP